MRVVPALLGILVALPAAAGDWPTFQGDAAHSGYIPIAIDPSQFSLRWQVAVSSSRPLSQPSAAQGRVFVSTAGYFSDEGLFAYEAVSGAEAWRVPFPDLFSVNGPAYADGRVYVQVCDHTPGTFLHAFDAATGAAVFSAPFAAQWERYLAPTVVDGVAYINGGYYGGMYAFGADRGEPRWFYALPQEDGWTPAVDALFAYAYLGGVYAIDRVTGALAFRIPDPNWSGLPGYQAPVLDRQGSLYGINDGRLVRFDLVLRRIAWEQPGGFTDQPAIAGGVLYAISAGALTAWEPSTPDLAWNWNAAGDALRSGLIVTDTHVLVSGTNATHAVSLASHRPDWSFPAGGRLALADGVLYIAGETGTLTAIDLGGGPCPVAQTPAPIRGLKAARSGADVAFAWDGDALALGGYRVYRFLVAADAPVANRTGERIFATAPDPAATSGSVAGEVSRPPELVFYQVLARCAGGAEGPL